MENFMIIGDGWAGWLHVFPRGNCILEVRNVNGDPASGQHSFVGDNAALDCEQFMDELDEKHGQEGAWA